MPCYYPIKAFLSDEVNASGKRSLVFKESEAVSAQPLYIPCGKCIGCRLEKSRQWAIRCVHESSMYDNNCFITLTISDEYSLPSKRGLCEGNPRSLYKEDFQRFMKRLRKRFGSGVRYFHCGEYGSKGGRPHHHACLFNFDFSDKEFWSCRGDVKLYRSRTLEELWPFGISTIGDVNFESAAYVARYCLKKYVSNKYNPSGKEDHYAGCNPEYITMSRRPGIGASFYEKFKSDIYPSGFVVVRGGIKCRPPEYYERKYDLTNHEDLVRIKSMVEPKVLDNPNNSPDRLRVREELKMLTVAQLKRGFENGTESVLGV